MVNKKNKSTTFKDYYQRPINNHKIGFKLVLGGTGLGKTSGAIDVMTDISNKGKKFVYIANRLQLLNEFAEKLEGKADYLQQKSDYETIASISDSEIESLKEDRIFIEYSKYLKRENLIRDANFFYKAFEFVKQNKVFEKTEEGRQILREKASLFMRFIKKVISTARKVSKNKLKTKYLSPNDFNELIGHKTIQKLFPYIPFIYDDSKQVLLITIQKAFSGVFDGSRMLNLYKFKNPQKDNAFIIFLDEFDFLESDLLSLITNDIAIDLPFDFVARFYNRLDRYKLPYPKFLEHKSDLRQNIESNIEDIRALKDKYNIPFPEINHFICSDDKLKGNAIFQTRNSISSKPIYLNADTSRLNTFSLEVNTKEANIYALLNVVKNATADIIRIFKELEIEESNIYNELLYHCFKGSDNFKRAIRQTKQFPYRRVKTSTDDSKLYHNGFGLYEIHSLLYESDYEEVELRYFSMFTTPEKILWQLCKNNLVFGLSATATFPRYLRNFDIAWLNLELKENYYKQDNFDIEIIQKLNTEKQEYRSNKVAIIQIKDTLNESSGSIKQKINNWIKLVTDTDRLGIFEKGAKKRFRTQRVRDFFNTLFWIEENRQNEIKTDTHLLFYSSFKQIETILREYNTIKDEDFTELIVEVKGKDGLFEYFEVNLNKQAYIVIFYNAEKAKEINHSEEAKKKYYEVFWADKPVILVTTYPSAGNGVNLQYYSSKSKRENSQINPDKDFRCIHLLDSPFYYFSSIDYNNQTTQEQNSIIKENIYKLAKLQKSYVITPSQFRGFLDNIRNAYLFNNVYLNTDDSLFNQIAVFVQALGRIERVWNKADDQTILLTTEIYNLFQDFISTPAYEKLKPYFSSNLLQLFSHITEHLVKGKIEQIEQVEDISRQNEKCRKYIGKALKDHDRLRKGVFKNDKEKRRKIRSQWEQLRYLALRHNFYSSSKEEKKPLLYQANAIFTTDDYDYINEGIWINPEQEIVQHALIDSTYSLWKLDQVYETIKRNDVIRGHFEFKHFSLGFQAKGKYFVPYFYQCILVGAIGEEGMKAIFEKEEINLSEEEIPDTLFEVADTKVQNKAWYIDCKNYSEYTINNFSLSKDDPLYHSKLNEEHFKKRALVKLKMLKSQHSKQDCKLIYINLFGDSSRPKKYLDANWKNIENDFNKAEIIVIQAAIKKDKPNEYSNDFTQFLNHLKSHL